MKSLKRLSLKHSLKKKDLEFLPLENKLIHIIISEGRHLCLTGKHEPFVCVKYAGKKFKTSVAKDPKMPNWHASCFFTQHIEHNVIKVYVRDSSRLKKYERCGFAEINLADLNMNQVNELELILKPKDGRGSRHMNGPSSPLDIKTNGFLSVQVSFREHDKRTPRTIMNDSKASSQPTSPPIEICEDVDTSVFSVTPRSERGGHSFFHSRMSSEELDEESASPGAQNKITHLEETITKLRAEYDGYKTITESENERLKEQVRLLTEQNLLLSIKAQEEKEAQNYAEVLSELSAAEDGASSTTSKAEEKPQPQGNDLSAPDQHQDSSEAQVEEASSSKDRIIEWDLDVARETGEESGDLTSPMLEELGRKLAEQERIMKDIEERVEPGCSIM